MVLMMKALAQDEGADDVGHGVADQRGQVHTASTGLLVQSQQLCFDGNKALQDARLQAQLPQAEVSERGVAELALLSPQRTVRCKDYS